VICDGTQKSQDLVVQKNGKVTEISAQVLIIRPCYYGCLGDANWKTTNNSTAIQL
jgi:hypothetical protein